MSPLRRLARRGSVRAFTAAPIPDAVFDELLATALRAPTSYNLQPFKVIEVREPSLRARVAELSGDQDHIRTAPRFVVVCADLSRPDLACAMHDQDRATDLDLLLQAAMDAAIFTAQLAAAAELTGLGTVMIGGVRNHMAALSALLHLPERAAPLVGLCLGHPAAPPRQKPRFPLGQTVCVDRYEAVGLDTVLAYDATMAEHFQTTGPCWSSRVADKLGRPASRDTVGALRAARLTDL